MKDTMKTVGLDTGLECLADPCFVIEMDGSYYVAVAVLGYSKRHTDNDPKKFNGVEHVQHLFEQGYDSAPLKACAINFNGTLPYTGPKFVDTASPQQAMSTSSDAMMSFGDGPLGMQTEPPGMQTEPPE